MSRVSIYCNKHEENHTVTTTQAIELIHIYQFSLAQYAYDEPLPVNGYSNAKQVLSKALCPLADLETIDREKFPLSKVAAYVRFMLNMKTEQQRRKPKKTP